MNVVVLDTDGPPPIDIALRSDDYQFKFGTSDYLFTLNDNIRVGLNHYMTVAITQASLPVSFYNINKTNNLIAFTYENLESTITIAPGNYNIGQMLTEIDTQLTALNFINKPVITWSSYSNRITLKFTAVAAENLFTLKNISTAHALIGFSKGVIHKNEDENGNVLNSLSGDSLCDIRGYDTLHFKTDLFSTGHTYSTKNKSSVNTLARIPVDAGAYAIIQYRPISPHQAEVKKHLINTFRVWIEDGDGNKVDFNGMKWTATLTVTFHKIKGLIDNQFGTTSYANNGVANNMNALRTYIDEITKEYRSMGQAAKIEKSTIY